MAAGKEVIFGTCLLVAAIIQCAAYTGAPEIQSTTAPGSYCAIMTCGDCYELCTNFSQYKAHSIWSQSSQGYVCTCLDGPMSGSSCVSDSGTAPCSTSCSSYGAQCSSCDAVANVCTQCNFGYSGVNCNIPADFDGYCTQVQVGNADMCQCYSFENVQACSPAAPSSESLVPLPSALGSQSLSPIFFLGGINTALTSQTAPMVQSWILSEGPVVAQVCAGSGFNPDQCTGGTTTMTCSDCNGATNHAITIVGWTQISGSPAWIIQNSWGSSGPGSGDSGFIYISFSSLGNQPGQFNIIGLVGLQYNNFPPALYVVPGSIPSSFNYAATGTYANTTSTCAFNVLNQMQCGSCFAFATSAAFAMTTCNLGSQGLMNLSPQFSLNVYYNYFQTVNSTHDPCDGGAPYILMDLLASISSYGTCTAGCSGGCLPYTESYCLEATDTAVAPGYVGTVSNPLFLGPTWRLDGIGSLLSSNLIFPGGTEALDVTSQAALNAVELFMQAWTSNVTHQSHQLMQVYSVHRKVVNGIMYKLKVGMTIPSVSSGNTHYFVHATAIHPPGHPEALHIVHYDTDLNLAATGTGGTAPSTSSSADTVQLGVGLGVGLGLFALFAVAAVVIARRVRTIRAEGQRPYRAALLQMEDAPAAP